MIQLEDGMPNFLFCETETAGKHITYPYGWEEENIPVADLEKAVRLVLDGKMTFGASSNFER